MVSTPARPFDLDGIVQGLRDRNKRIVSRCMTWIEDGDDIAQDILDRLAGAPASAHERVPGGAMVVGVTGVPGAGKSTLIPRLAGMFSARGDVPAVLAVDPSSPLTGGALLGDRTRYDDAAGEAAFYRSVASRGSLGGLAHAIDDMIGLLSGAGYSPIFVETVGTGQSEVAISRIAHTTVATFVPGLGDGIQAIKAGLMEVADIIAVTKSDVDPIKAGKTAQTLKAGLSIGKGPRAHHGEPGSGTTAQAQWEVPVCLVSAQSGQGLEELVGHIVAHQRFLVESGRVDDLRGLGRVERFRRELQEALMARLALTRGSLLSEAETSARCGREPVRDLVKRLLEGWGE